MQGAVEAQHCVGRKVFSLMGGGMAQDSVQLAPVAMRAPRLRVPCNVCDMWDFACNRRKLCSCGFAFCWLQLAVVKSNEGPRVGFAAWHNGERGASKRWCGFVALCRARRAMPRGAA
jgi:hypothetical protein